MLCWLCDLPATEPSGLCAYCEQHATVGARWAHERGIPHHHFHWCPGCGTRWQHQVLVRCAQPMRCERCKNAQAVELLGEPTVYEPDWANRGFKKEKRVPVVAKHRGRIIRGKGRDR